MPAFIITACAIVGAVTVVKYIGQGLGYAVTWALTPRDQS